MISSSSTKESPYNHILERFDWNVDSILPWFSPFEWFWHLSSVDTKGQMQRVMKALQSIQYWRSLNNGQRRVRHLRMDL